MRAEIHSTLHMFIPFPFSSTAICSPREQDGLDNWYGQNEQKPQKFIPAESP